MSAEGPPIEDQEFLQKFERCTLPFTEWNHRAHLKVAYLYLTAHPLEEATDRIRRGIKRYNAANDVPEGPDVGYNETTTVAFMHLVHATIKAYGTVFPVRTADEFCTTHPHLLQKSILRLFYSPARRMHPDAKHSFVEPDLTPLPKGRVARSTER